MVLADRNDDSRIGRRSHTSSPNGHLTDEGSATDDSEQDHGMRVGDDYQASVPEIISATEACPDFAPERALLVWSPCSEIPDGRLNEYITLAKEKYGYNAEQALGMLFWHKYDLEKAVADLANFTPFPDEWTVEDKVLFEQAFQFHGKNFHKIRQMLPDKTIPSLVKYYYSWKKTRTRTSLMDRQARKLAVARDEESDGGSEQASENESDMDADNGEIKEESVGKGSCGNCSASSVHLYASSKGNLCNACYQYWKRTGLLKGCASSGSLRKHESRHHPGGGGRAKRKPPRGMFLQYDDLVAMATGPPGQGDAILRAMDSEVISLKRQVQNNKQIISQLKHKTSLGIENLRPPEGNTRVNSKWSNDELLIAVQGIRKYGRDFKAIAEVIGNKTEAHIRSFFVNYRRRYNLDAVLQEFEAEHGITSSDEKEEKPEAPKDGNNSAGGSSCGSRPTSPAAGSANGSAGNPPPLLRPTGSLHRKPTPPPLQQTRAGTWSILQQPPPLIRPSASATTVLHGQAL
ncbi:REST corepressor 3-like isoform X2 [Ornithodoros turicata]|uniref:Putative dna-binding protein n=1 Tax=Ornithodoros turicata TaxID=34597 RepID=A0A2R5LBA3_9ACAR